MNDSTINVSAPPKEPSNRHSEPTFQERSSEDRRHQPNWRPAELLKLRISLDQKRQLTDATQLMAESMANMFQAHAVFVSFRVGNSLKLLGTESAAKLQAGTKELVRSAHLESASAKSILTSRKAQETSSGNEDSSEPPSDDQAPNSILPSPIHQNLCDAEPAFDGCDAITQSIYSQSGDPILTITVVGSDPDTYAAQMRPIMELVVSHLLLLQHASKTISERIGDRIRASRPKLKFWGIVAAAVLLFACIPVPHRISCELQVRPQIRRFVAAPFQGVLRSCSVRAGDVVEAGQLLATMDEDELRMQISSLLAERESARKSKSAAMAKGETIEAQKARLEYNRLSHKLDLLETRLRTLEINSPISGVVLVSDLDDAVGAPLQQGRNLFEIAPLEKMKFEIYISQDDLAYVKVGQAVTISLDATSGSWTGKVSRIQPQSTTFENESVFVAEVSMEENDQNIRPGMLGYASVSSDFQPLGWVLLRKPVRYMQRLFGFQG